MLLQRQARADRHTERPDAGHLAGVASVGRGIRAPVDGLHQSCSCPDPRERSGGYAWLIRPQAAVDTNDGLHVLVLTAGWSLSSTS